jgi:hypothetical protein
VLKIILVPILVAKTECQVPSSCSLGREDRRKVDVLRREIGDET